MASTGFLEQYDIQEVRELKEECLVKLLNDNIYTVTQFLNETKEYIMALTDMTRSEYELFMNEVLLRCRPQKTSMLWMPKRNSLIFSTGIKRLDDALEGGLYGGEILEIYGLSCSGKTQMCLSIAAEFCHRKDVMVVYLDLKNDFVPQRFNELCENSAKSLDRLYLVRENKVKDIVDLIENLEKKLCIADPLFEELRVIILDSLPMAFYPCMEEDDNTLSRVYQERLSQSLRRLAKRYDVVIVVTNHPVTVSDWIDKTAPRSYALPFETELPEMKPALGSYWFSVPHFRINLSQIEFHSRFRARLCKSSRTPLDETFDFKITHTGIGTLSETSSRVYIENFI